MLASLVQVCLVGDWRLRAFGQSVETGALNSDLGLASTGFLDGQSLRLIVGFRVLWVLRVIRLLLRLLNRVILLLTCLCFTATLLARLLLLNSRQSGLLRRCHFRLSSSGRLLDLRHTFSDRHRFEIVIVIARVVTNGRLLLLERGHDSDSLLV